MARKALALWLPAALGLTAFALVVYGAVQQSLRSGADDPQVAMARAAVAALDAGTAPPTAVGPGRVAIAGSLDPWVAVFDGARHPVASSAAGIESFPTSVFDSVPARGRDEVTWQPAPGVRQAAVVMRWDHGWVVAGRSLELVEEREQRTLLIALAGWGAALVAAGVGAGLGALWSEAPPP